MIASHSTSSFKRAVLAHDDQVVREALRVLTVQVLDMQIAGEARDGDELRIVVKTERPDLVVVSWKLMAPDVAATVRELREGRDGARVVVLGPRPDTRRAALAAGADAYISMVDAPDVVASTLRSAVRRTSSTDISTQRCPEGTGGEKSIEPGGRS